MKKCIVIILSCFLLTCIGCKKEDFVSNSYKASLEYHFTDENNQQAVKTIINNISGVWNGEIEITLVNTVTTDAEACSKFETAVKAILEEKNSWDPFFHMNDSVVQVRDSMIYSLERTTPGDESILRKVQFDKNGHRNL